MLLLIKHILLTTTKSLMEGSENDANKNHEMTFHRVLWSFCTSLASKELLDSSNNCSVSQVLCITVF